MSPWLWSLWPPNTFKPHSGQTTNYISFGNTYLLEQRIAWKIVFLKEDFRGHHNTCVGNMFRGTCVSAYEAREKKRIYCSFTCSIQTLEESVSGKRKKKPHKIKPTSTAWKCFMSASHPIKTLHYKLKLPSRPPHLFSLCPAWHRAQTGLPQTDSGTAFQAPIHTEARKLSGACQLAVCCSHTILLV